MEWQPIDTAPKSVRILLYWNGIQGDEVDSGAFHALGKIYEGGKLWVDRSYDNEKVWPTHWMPLPSPPST